MKMSRTAIKELTAAYRAVLKHAFIAAMGAMVVIGGASAGDAKTTLFVGIGETKDLAGVHDGYITQEVEKKGNVADVAGTLNVAAGSEFMNNKSDFIGGAILARKKSGVTLNIGENTIFDNNMAKYDGGAIGNYQAAIIGKNVIFRNNHANIGIDGRELTADDNPIGGGAISMGVDATLDLTGGIFENNTSGYDGGAIGTRRTLQKKEVAGFDDLVNYIKIADSRFTGNQATGKTSDIANGKKVGGNGGAIANTFATTEISGTTFTKNTAAANGGAIYNHTFINVDAEGTDTGLGGVMTIRDSVFGENTATTWGGAIFNDGTMTLGDGVSFTGNSANFGGAVWNQGTLKAEAGTKFIGNKATFAGGALYNEDNTTINSLAGIMFENNSARQGGAINNAWRNKDKGTLAAKIESISQSRFVNNSAIQSEGGAIRNQGIIGEIKGTVFDSNIAGEGGALWNGSLGQVGVIDDVDFINNKATLKNLTGELGQGGAIANRNKTDDDKIAITIKGSRFVGNQAAALGGAIANMKPNGDKAGTVKMQITDATFTGNTAGEFGGAIYNYEDAETTLSGKNTFTGNMAGDVGNDIYNLGKLTVSDGTTTIDGGIAGDGALTIADGATLNIGTTTVQQKELTLDGTVGATIVGANNYGKLLAETYKGNGKVSLNVATTGTYNIFGENANEYTVVDAGAIYDVTKGDNGAVTIATKNVEEIAKETGLTDIAANTVAALANVDNDLANIASLNAQQALRNGDTDYVEIESAKANPVDKPVVQSVAQSVQGAVMTLAANRMAGAPTAGTMGRSGGDLSDADYGVWAQGMFNKSKFNGQFNGYTRGVSAGFDALIDKQYTIGLGYAFGHSDVHANGGRDTEIDSNSIFAYAQYKPSEWFVNAALNYTMSKYTETVDAFGVRLKSDYDTDAFGGQVMTGYDFASGLTPEIGLRYLHVTQDSYNNGLNHVSSDDTDFLTGIAGMKYRFAIENDSVINWFPELRAAATYDFVSDKAMSTVTMPGAASYVVDGDRLSRFGGEFGIGLTAEYNGLEISLVYDLDLHKDYTSQTGMAKFRYEF